MSNVESFFWRLKIWHHFGVVNVNINVECKNEEWEGPWAKGAPVLECIPSCIGLKAKFFLKN